MLVDVVSSIVRSTIVDKALLDGDHFLALRWWFLMDHFRASSGRFSVAAPRRREAELSAWSATAMWSSPYTSSRMRRAWEFEGSGMLHNSIVAATIF